MAETSGFLIAQPYGSMDSKEARNDRRQYLDAVQYAHKYCGVSPAAHHLGVSDRTDPHRFLAAWWQKRLLDVDALEAEQDRPWWIDEIDEIGDERDENEWPE